MLVLGLLGRDLERVLMLREGLGVRAVTAMVGGMNDPCTAGDEGTVD